MRIVKEPQVFLIATTELVDNGLNNYLHAIGDPAWKPDPNVSSAENVIEAGGRLCYMSWQPYDPNKPEATNPNVKKVREGNDVYLKNVLESKHGALLEHCCVTFIFKDLSRVCTHELVRHRAGMAYSQQSLRYIRLDDLGFWMPPAVVVDEVLSAIFVETVNTLEGVQKKLADHTGINDVKNFHLKKQMTSMFRRLAPIGLATSIMVTGNLRSWRHIIELRTSTAAEEEIRLVIGKAAALLKPKYPNVFQDMSRSEDGSWVFEHSKV